MQLQLKCFVNTSYFSDSSKGQDIKQINRLPLHLLYHVGGNKWRHINIIQASNKNLKR